MTIFDLIQRNEGVCGGEPCLAGHRIQISHIEALLRLGWSYEKILEAYPQIDQFFFRQAMREWFNLKSYYSGMCVCGHLSDRHHRSFIMQREYSDLLGELTYPGECLALGTNEHGGEDGNGNVHCFAYTDRDHPDPIWRGRPFFKL